MMKGVSEYVLPVECSSAVVAAEALRIIFFHVDSWHSSFGKLEEMGVLAITLIGRLSTR